MTKKSNTLIIPRILSCGDTAVTVEFGQIINAEINERVIGFDRTITAENLDGIIETVPTYRSVTVHYDPNTLSFRAICEHLTRIFSQSVAATEAGRHWRIPVVYGGEYGLDLDFIAKTKSVAPEDIIASHVAATYRVYMIGFSPGFSYLGGLDPKLVTPRRQNPRLTSPSGCIAIGGEQTAVQCLPGPLGWHILGRTPVQTYHPNRKKTFLLEPGDTVNFFPIPEQDWAYLDKAAKAGETIAELVQI